MHRSVTATEARVHFGELLERVARDQDTVIVERGGVPQAVVISIAEYERLRVRRASADWREKAQVARQMVRSELGDRQMPPPADFIRAMREERDEQLGLPRRSTRLSASTRAWFFSSSSGPTTVMHGSGGTSGRPGA